MFQSTGDIEKQQVSLAEEVEYQWVNRERKRTDIVQYIEKRVLVLRTPVK